MKEIVVISGKGGTGKTSLTASFSVLGGKKVVVADCDVDAADMHLLLKPDFNFKEDFFSGELAVIDQDKCVQCGKCQEVCRFNAIEFKHNKYTIRELECEGCGYCSKICPEDAIQNHIQKSGQCFVSEIRTGSKMVHARLGIGADNSGKLVAKVKNEAKELAINEVKEYILVDGAPGIGCPVVSSLSGANLVVLVTEPTVSGIHDLKRVFKLVKNFKIEAVCIINKADINTKMTTEIKHFLQDEEIPLVSEIPYNEDFTKAMILGKTILEINAGELQKTIQKSWKRILHLLYKENINDYQES